MTNAPFTISIGLHHAQTRFCFSVFSVPPSLELVSGMIYHQEQIDRYIAQATNNLFGFEPRQSAMKPIHSGTVTVEQAENIRALGFGCVPGSATVLRGHSGIPPPDHDAEVSSSACIWSGCLPLFGGLSVLNGESCDKRVPSRVRLVCSKSTSTSDLSKSRRTMM